ncbi:MAG: 30S ribosomal protein S5 [Candidatus Diapherotrites archaeon]
MEEKRDEFIYEEKTKSIENWVPKTELGREVINGKIKSLEELLLSNRRIMEPEIVDYLEPNLESVVIDVRKTARVVRAGRKFSFRVGVVVGNRNGIVGFGTAKDKEKWPAVKKATANAKMNLILVKRGCGSWECGCGEKHSIKFKVSGQCASVRVTLIPAPKGVGLVVGRNAKPVFELAGIKDIWSKTKGNTPIKLNFVGACIDALKKTTKLKEPDVIVKEKTQHKVTK